MNFFAKVGSAIAGIYVHKYMHYPIWMSSCILPILNLKNHLLTFKVHLIVSIS